MTGCWINIVFLFFKWNNVFLCGFFILFYFINSFVTLQEHESRPSRPRKSPHKKYSIPQRPRKISDSTITEEDIDKTYTGLDREIAEEFISVAMEPKRHWRETLTGCTGRKMNDQKSCLWGITNMLRTSWKRKLMIS